MAACQSPVWSKGTDGNFYGTTFFGGASQNGNVFQMTPGGALVNIYSFAVWVSGFESRSESDPTQ